MTKLVGSADAAFCLYSVMPLDWIWSLARMHGRLTYLLNRGERSTVRQNLVDAVGATRSDEIESLTSQFFEYRRLRGALLAVAPRLTSAEMATLLRVEGLEHLDGALERKRGVILLGSHLNSLVMFNAIIMLREHGYEIGVALPEPGDPWAPSTLRKALNRRLKTRPMFELTGAFHAQFNVRPIVRRLADNLIVAQTGDGLHSARFVEVEFLGRRIPFPTGMASVAQLTGATVIPIFQAGTPPDELRVVLEEPRSIERRGDGANEALKDAVAAYAKRLEHHLRESVACWEHWVIQDTLQTMSTWPERSLKERYKV